MELHPEPLTRVVVEAEGVAAESVHVAVAVRQTPVRHHDRHLVQGFGQVRPEVPVVLRAAEVGPGVALDRMVQVRELQRVAEEEHRGVVADDVPVALIGVEAHSEAPDVTFGVGSASLPGHGREAHDHLGRLADLGEHAGTAVPRDVAGHREGAVGAGALGVHAPFGDHLAVEVRELLEEPHILEQHRPPGTRGQAVLVLPDRRPRHRRQRLGVPRFLSGSFDRHGSTSSPNDPSMRISS